MGDVVYRKGPGERRGEGKKSLTCPTVWVKRSGDMVGKKGRAEQRLKGNMKRGFQL